MLNVCYNISEIDLVEWNRFVFEHPDGTVFHTPEMYNVYSNIKDCFPVIVCIKENETIAGLIISVVYQNGGKLGAFLTKRAICMGGAICDDRVENVEQFLYNSYNKYVRHLGCIYSEIRPVLEPRKKDLLRYGFSREDHLSIVLDISQSEDVLFSGLHKERRRNIAHAQKVGLSFRELETDQEIEEFSLLIKNTYQRKKVPMSYLDVFKFGKRSCQGRMHFFGAFLNEKMIAGQVRLFYKNLVYAWFAGSDENYFKCRPNDYLTWNVLLWSKLHGYSTFDFGGGGKPGIPYGVRDYKMKYGCDIYNFGRFCCVYKPALYKLGKWGYSIIHKMK